MMSILIGDSSEPDNFRTGLAESPRKAIESAADPKILHGTLLRRRPITGWIFFVQHLNEIGKPHPLAFLQCLSDTIPYRRRI